MLINRVYKNIVQIHFVIKLVIQLEECVFSLKFPANRYKLHKHNPFTTTGSSSSLNVYEPIAIMNTYPRDSENPPLAKNVLHFAIQDISNFNKNRRQTHLQCPKKISQGLVARRL